MRSRSHTTNMRLLALALLAAVRRGYAFKEYAYNTSSPVYSELSSRIQRMRAERKPLRIKVNSHPCAGKTFFLVHHKRGFMGIKLLDFDAFRGARRTSSCGAV